eukprot:scaffold83154_cov64-Phaeocystis_antarctica.AAC.2
MAGWPRRARTRGSLRDMVWHWDKPPGSQLAEADLHALKAAGADGVVVGLLLADGRVDESNAWPRPRTTRLGRLADNTTTRHQTPPAPAPKVRLRRLVQLAAPLPVTFHRAIDVTPDTVALRTPPFTLIPSHTPCHACR